MDKAQKLHANAAGKPLVQRAPFKVAAGLTALLTLSAAGYLMGGQDTKKDTRNTQAVEAKAPARITPKDLNIEMDGKKTVAKPIDVHGVLGKKDDSIIAKVWDAIGPVKAYAGDENLVPASQVLGALKLTEELKQKKIVKEIKFDSKKEIEQLKFGEWVIKNRKDMNSSSESITVIYNELNTETRSSFIDRSIVPLAKQLGVLDTDLVTGFAIQRPDDPKQSILVLACKDHVDIYVLNDKKEIEWIPILLDKVGIEKKPEVAVFTGENKLGKFIGLAVYDEKIKNQKSGTATFIIVRVYPEPKSSDKNLDIYGTYLAKMDLARR